MDPSRPPGALDRTRLAVDVARAVREGGPGIRRRQQVRLRALVAHARDRSPGYAAHYRGLGDDPPLAALPPVAKPQLMADLDAWVCDPAVTRAGLESVVADPTTVGEPYLDRYLVCASSGTTGRRALFVHDPWAVSVYQALSTGRITRYWLGAATWPGMAAHRMRWAAVVGTGGHFAGEAWMESERLRSRWRRRAYRVLSAQLPIDQVAQRLSAFDPAVLTGYPSALELLAAAQLDGRLRLRPVLVEPTGETLLPGSRQLLSDAFGCPVRPAYAASEFPLLAFGCREEWLHVNADWVIVEPVDADGGPTPAGEMSHSVLLTNLANRVQPLIRYDLGDSVLVRPDRCPCGLSLPAIRVVGRTGLLLELSDGHGRTVQVPALVVGTVIDRVPGVVQWQLVARGTTELRLRLRAAGDRRPDGVWEEARTHLRGYLAGVGLDRVRVTRADEPPQRCASGKVSAVVTD